MTSTSFGTLKESLSCIASSSPEELILATTELEDVSGLVIKAHKILVVVGRTIKEKAFRDLCQQFELSPNRVESVIGFAMNKQIAEKKKSVGKISQRPNHHAKEENRVIFEGHDGATYRVSIYGPVSKKVKKYMAEYEGIPVTNSRTPYHERARELAANQV